jgi:hypothetical protein
MSKPPLVWPAETMIVWPLLTTTTEVTSVPLAPSVPSTNVPDNAEANCRS